MSTQKPIKEKKNTIQVELFKKFINSKHEKHCCSKPTIDTRKEIIKNGFTDPENFYMERTPSASGFNDVDCYYIKTPPKSAGVYFISINNKKLSDSFQVLYVGQAVDLHKRILGNYVKDGSHLYEWLIKLILVGWDIHFSWRVLKCREGDDDRMSTRQTISEELTELEDFFLNKYDFVLNTVKNGEVRRYEFAEILKSGESFKSIQGCPDHECETKINPIDMVTREDLMKYKNRAPKGHNYKTKLQEIYILVIGKPPSKSWTKEKLMDEIGNRDSRLKIN